MTSLPRDAVLLVIDVRNGEADPRRRSLTSSLLHNVALADLHGEFATVIDTNTALERAS